MSGFESRIAPVAAPEPYNETDHGKHSSDLYRDLPELHEIRARNLASSVCRCTENDAECDPPRH